MLNIKVRKFLELIKFSHTIFALPFALIATTLALQETHQLVNEKSTWIIFFWIVIAMAGARSGAMGFNRFIDRKWDAENPRTASRPSVTGEISAFQIIVMVVISFAVLIFAAWNLNLLAFWLSPVAIFLVCFYSYTKRFSSFSHFFLGMAIGSAPVAAWIAVTGTFSASSIIIGLSVLTWMAGFDILYALQDLEYDKSTQLHSIPVKIGITKSLLLAKLLHILTVGLWIILSYLEALHWIFVAGIIVCSALLIWEHSLLKKDDLSKLDMAFFNMNAIISVTLFITLTLDVILFL